MRCRGRQRRHQSSIVFDLWVISWPAWLHHVDVATPGHGALSQFPSAGRLDCRTLSGGSRCGGRRRLQSEARPPAPAVVRSRWRESGWNGGHRPTAGRRRPDRPISRRRASFAQIYCPAGRRRRRRSTTRLLVGGTSQRASATVGAHRPWRHLPTAHHVSADVRHRRSSRTVSSSPVSSVSWSSDIRLLGQFPSDNSLSYLRHYALRRCVLSHNRSTVAFKRRKLFREYTGNVDQAISRHSLDRCCKFTECGRLNQLSWLLVAL